MQGLVWGRALSFMLLVGCTPQRFSDPRPLSIVSAAASADQARTHLRRWMHAGGASVLPKPDALRGWSTDGSGGLVVYEVYRTSHPDPGGLVVAVHAQGSNMGEMAEVGSAVLERGFHLMLLDVRSGGAGFGPRRNFVADAVHRFGLPGTGLDDVELGLSVAVKKAYADRPIEGHRVGRNPVFLLAHARALPGLARLRSVDAWIVLGDGTPRQAPLEDSLLHVVAQGPDPSRGIPSTIAPASLTELWPNMRRIVERRRAWFDGNDLSARVGPTGR